jgi:hypothetical protein
VHALCEHFGFIDLMYLRIVLERVLRQTGNAEDRTTSDPEKVFPIEHKAIFVTENADTTSSKEGQCPAGLLVFSLCVRGRGLRWANLGLWHGIDEGCVGV